MAAFTRIHKIIGIGLGAVSGGAIYYTQFHNSENKKAYASWTTNYVPSVKWDDNWDHRSPKSLINPKRIDSDKVLENIINEKIEHKTPSATRHLILVRHGQYNSSGETDDQCILTNLGRSQAEHTGKRLKELSLPYTSMIISTMSRARETGELILKSLPELPVSNCDLLREGAPVPPEPPVGHWKPEPYFHQDGARIEAAFREYFHRAVPEQEKDTYTILVCHANVIRYFVCRALQFPPEAWLRISLNHASITWLSISPSGRVVLRTLGDTGHMPPKMISNR